MSFTFLGSSLLRPCKCIQRLDLPDSLAQYCKRSIYSNNLIESLFRSDIVNIDLCSFFQVLSIARYSSLPCLSIRCPRKTPSCRDYCLVQPYNSIRIKGQGKMLHPPPFRCRRQQPGLEAATVLELRWSQPLNKNLARFVCSFVLANASSTAVQPSSYLSPSPPASSRSPQTLLVNVFPRAVSSLAGALPSRSLHLKSFPVLPQTGFTRVQPLDRGRWPGRRWHNH